MHSVFCVVVVSLGLVAGRSAVAAAAGSNAVADVPVSAKAGAVPPSCQPTFGSTDTWLSIHQQQLANAAKQNVRIALLGDSLVAGWSKESWTEYWAPRGAFNFGIAADRTEHVLWRIRQGLFDSIDPAVVILQIGTNNLKSGDIRRSPEETVAGIRAIVEATRAAKPGARIIVMAIFPRQPKYEWIDAAIREANVRLCALQREMEDVRVVDIGAHFRGEDLQPSRMHLRDDMLHLKPSAYALWTQSVADMVDAALARKQAK